METADTAKERLQHTALSSTRTSPSTTCQELVEFLGTNTLALPVLRIRLLISSLFAAPGVRMLTARQTSGDVMLLLFPDIIMPKRLALLVGINNYGESSGFPIGTKE